MSVFSVDIVLDEEAFDTAVRDFEALAVQLQQLRGKLEDMLNDLKAGFNTPAGVKFINSCEANLFQPLDAQKLVIDHIADSLAESKQAYESVFREYESLQTAIRLIDQQ